MTTALTPSADNPPAGARPFASFQMRADVRLFQTSQHLACQEDPELFFNPRTKHRAIKRCNDCPFRGRCGYNAVATGARRCRVKLVAPWVSNEPGGVWKAC